MNHQSAKSATGSWKNNRKDSLETEKTLDTLKKVNSAFANMDGNTFEQILNSKEFQTQEQKKQERTQTRLEGGTLFSYQKIEEDRQISEIKELIKQIKQEVEMIKKADRALSSEVKDIEKITFESLPERSGIYHVRVLEVFLRVLQNIRLKIGESKTWMEALMTKKAKRGSLFASRAQKKGTQYSLSQEISTARSVQ